MHDRPRILPVLFAVCLGATFVAASTLVFSGYQDQKPGVVHKITVADLPQPFATKSAGNNPSIIARPKDAWPQAPAGFKVELFAENLHNPRLLRTAPNGDVFVVESGPGDIKVFRGIDANGKPQQSEVFAKGFTQPFGLAFYPSGPNPEWIYVGNTDSVVRIPYRNGDLKARGPAQKLTDLPGRRPLARRRSLDS